MGLPEVFAVSELTKRFGEITALDKLSITMNKGIFGLVGPNGAGKTTLLKILLGLLQADEGHASVLGLDVTKKSFDIRRQVGVLHEHPAYPPSLRVYKYLERVSNLYRDSMEILDVLDIVALSDAKHRKIGNLSAGMRQRLGIAQALIGNPELVFLDEPTSNLDVMGRIDLLKTISHIHDTNDVSFCIISHVLSELERVCSSIAFINSGKTLTSGSIHEVISKFTSNHYNILVSDPKKLCDKLERIENIISAEVSGVKMLTIVTKIEDIEMIKTDILQVAKNVGISVYEITKTSSLEQAFLEALRNE